MRDHRYRVLLRHENAQMFFEAASRPDLEELRRRDRFFEQIAKEVSYYEDDGDLVTEIPDIDVKLLMESKEHLDAEYGEWKEHIRALSFTGEQTIKSGCVIHYCYRPNGKSPVRWGDAYQQSGKAGWYASCAGK